jgi:hypothetical protein
VSQAQSLMTESRRFLTVRRTDTAPILWAAVLRGLASVDTDIVAGFG